MQVVERVGVVDCRPGRIFGFRILHFCIEQGCWGEYEDAYCRTGRLAYGDLETGPLQLPDTPEPKTPEPDSSGATYPNPNTDPNPNPDHEPSELTL